jgi:polyhydroxybutyrate depolymerase
MGGMVRTLNTAAGPRFYHLHEPPGHDGRTPLPLLLFLHGAGGTAAWALDETRWPQTADREGFFLLTPEATRADPKRPAGFLHNPQVWNDGAPAGQVGHIDVDDVGFIAALLDEVLANWPIDARRVFVTGFSNGAALTFRLGAELSERFAALAPVSGVCWLDQPQPVRSLPTLYLIGDADPLVPLDGGTVVNLWGDGPMVRPPVWETIRKWCDALGCPATPALVEVHDEGQRRLYRPGRDSSEMCVWLLAGHGHHWPGGRGQLSRRLFGAPARGFSANERIWSFFKQTLASRERERPE